MTINRLARGEYGYQAHCNDFQAYRNDSSSCAHGPNIQHEDFSFAQLLYLALLLTTLHDDKTQVCSRHCLTAADTGNKEMT